MLKASSLLLLKADALLHSHNQGRVSLSNSTIVVAGHEKFPVYWTFEWQ